MRLSKIKLAGFKSFVDPTVIPFVSNLSAVVGPNGCGKSNVIDAIRWVMGESSAKHLRGGQLADVIFNGSTSRKPLGQASVELYFDNSDGTLAGEYAGYSEVVIRREVNKRDGQSFYALNGVRCRRSDVMDLFRGTGLGPRSYAIIEQGMISRVIEAKPEDLRVFIEEAAGISKYKERRKETENRIHHTRENLERLTDLRNELSKQVEHLKKQSVSAQKFKSLREEEHILAAQLSALSWQRFNAEVLSQESLTQKLVTELEGQSAAYQHIETQLEKHRIEQQDLHAKLHEVQGQYYAAGSDISNLEQKCQHQIERGVQLNADRNDAQKNLNQAYEHRAHDGERIQILESAIAAQEPIYETTRLEADSLFKEQKEKEESLERLREQWGALMRALEQIHRQSEIEKVKIVQLEGQVQQALTRFTRLEEEKTRLESEDSNVNLESLEQAILAREDQLQTLTQRLQDQKQIRQDQQNDRNSLKPEINQYQKGLQQLEGRKASLEALQQAALGKESKHLTNWLEGQALLEDKRLAECIQVSEPWSQALEMVLGDYLEALYLAPNQMVSAMDAIEQFSEGSLVLLNREPIASSDKNSDSASELLSHARLLDHVQLEGSEGILKTLLEAIYVAPTLAQALSLLEEFETKGLNYSVITPDGVWLGRGWARVKKGINDDQSGVLKREQQLREIESQLATQKLELENKQLNFNNLEDSIAQCEFVIDGLQAERNQAHRALSDENAQLKTQKATLMHKAARLLQIQAEQDEIQKSNQEAQAKIVTARNVIAETIEQLADKTELKTQLETTRRTLSEIISAKKSASQQKTNAVHALALELQKHRTELGSLLNNQNRVSQLLESLTEKIQSLNKAIETNKEPLVTLQEALSKRLEERLIIEVDLNEVRDTVSGLDNEIQTLDKQRTVHDNATQSLRAQIETAKIEGQALHIYRENAQNQLLTKECKLEEVLAQLPPEANESDWQARLTKIGNRIQNLGAINLASIEEYETHLERKQYLDEQDTDLNESLNMLQHSIDKIDKETRLRFKETFNIVNENFKVLFPKLFGGGEANLGLTGDDLLESGVTVVARPPGKKNSTIHLLSGGEKALTAVSLVFSIFQLNPAPFCLLDEVDAPLDDNNVGRFCALVKEMSQSVQFIYISHNKLALEMAGELQGVTMREPGVSRIVTVDIEKATAMVV